MTDRLEVMQADIDAANRAWNIMTRSGLAEAFARHRIETNSRTGDTVGGSGAWEYIHAGGPWGDIDELLNKIYAHNVIKYDPPAAKRVAIAALKEAFERGASAGLAYADNWGGRCWSAQRDADFERFLRECTAPLVPAPQSITPPEVGGSAYLELAERLRCTTRFEGGINQFLAERQEAADAIEAMHRKFEWATMVESHMAQLLDRSFANGRKAGLEEARIAALSTPEVVDGTAGLVEALTEARAALHQHYVDWDGEPEDAVPLQLARARCDAALSQHRGVS